jgi:hypothetical protein
MDQASVHGVNHDWSIVWEGSTYHRDDLTVAHARVVSELIGDDSWAWVELDPAGGPLTFVAVLIAFVAVEHGFDADDVGHLVAELSTVPLTELLEAFHPASEVAA